MSLSSYFADECRGVACEAGGITGDVDHAGCAGRGNLAADLGTSTGTRRIKHYDIRLGQMRRHMVQRARDVTRAGVHVVQVHGAQIALGVLDGHTRAFNAEHAGAFTGHCGQRQGEQAGTGIQIPDYGVRR